MLGPGSDQINTGGLDAAVPEKVGQLGNVFACLVKDRSKQMAQIMRKYLMRVYTGMFAQGLQLSPNLPAAQFLSAFGAKNRAGSGFLFLSKLCQLSTQFARQQNHPDLPFERDFRLALADGLYGDIRHLADPDAGGADGFNQKFQTRPI